MPDWLAVSWRAPRSATMLMLLLRVVALLLLLLMSIRICVAIAAVVRLLLTLIVMVVEGLTRRLPVVTAAVSLLAAVLVHLLVLVVLIVFALLGPLFRPLAPVLLLLQCARMLVLSLGAALARLSFLTADRLVTASPPE